MCTWLRIPLSRAEMHIVRKNIKMFIPNVLLILECVALVVSQYVRILSCLTVFPFDKLKVDHPRWEGLEEGGHFDSDNECRHHFTKMCFSSLFFFWSFFTNVHVRIRECYSTRLGKLLVVMSEVVIRCGSFAWKTKGKVVIRAHRKTVVHDCAVRQWHDMMTYEQIVKCFIYFWNGTHILSKWDRKWWFPTCFPSFSRTVKELSRKKIVVSNAQKNRSTLQRIHS